MIRVPPSNIKFITCFILVALAFVAFSSSTGEMASVSTRSVIAIQAPNSASAIKGEFKSIGLWQTTTPVIIHASVLPDGRVLFWGRDKVAPGSIDDVVGESTARIWTPGTQKFEDVNNDDTNLFCSGHSFLPDGRLFVTGGHQHKHPNSQAGAKQTNIFDPLTKTWKDGPVMVEGRWYPFNVTLETGEVAIVSGMYAKQESIDLPPPVANQIHPEIYNPNTNTLEVMDAPTTNITPSLYPYLFLDPISGGNRGVFIAGPKNSFFWNPRGGTGKGSWSPASGLPNEHVDGSAVMYDSEQGAILMVGGRHNNKPTDSARKIILNQSNPVWQTVNSMKRPRTFHTTTLLPNGKVLVTGGVPCYSGHQVEPCYVNNPDYDDVTRHNLDITNEAEMWDPVSGQWQLMAKAEKTRGYHSTSLLLPDATVLVGGFGLPDGLRVPPDTAKDWLNNRRHTTGERTVEIYSPPYLFNSDGTPATRPVINSAPAEISYGQEFPLSYGNASGISKVTWVRLPSVTHGFSQDQRLIVFDEGDITVSPVSPNLLSIKAPTDPRKCPPGHYMMFALNSAGVPSLARIVRISHGLGLPEVSSRVVRNFDGRLMVFYRGAEAPYPLRYNVQTLAGANQWSGELDLGGGLATDPVAIANHDGRIQVFIRGTDNQVWTRTQETPGSTLWTQWAAIPNLGQPPTPTGNPPPVPGAASEPVVVRNRDGRLQIFVRSADNETRYTVQTSAGGNVFDSWRTLAGGALLMPHLGINKDGRVQVFVLGTDTRIWYRTQTTPGNVHQWTEWAALPNTKTPCAPACQPFAATSRPTVAQNEDGRLEVYVRGSDDKVYMTWQASPNSDSNWVASWQPTGMLIFNRPSLALDAEGRLQIFARRKPENDVRYRRQIAASASGLLEPAASLPNGVINTPPEVIRHPDGRLEVFARGENNHIYHNWQLSPASPSWSGWYDLGGNAANF